MWQLEIYKNKRDSHDLQVSNVTGHRTKGPKDSNSAVHAGTVWKYKALISPRIGCLFQTNCGARTEHRGETKSVKSFQCYVAGNVTTLCQTNSSKAQLLLLLSWSHICATFVGIPVQEQKHFCESVHNEHFYGRQRAGNIHMYSYALGNLCLGIKKQSKLPHPTKSVQFFSGKWRGKCLNRKSFRLTLTEKCGTSQQTIASSN